MLRGRFRIFGQNADDRRRVESQCLGSGRRRQFCVLTTRLWLQKMTA
jgi:hypothetical protein